MKVFFETFGCRLNKAESLQDEANYLANGWQLARAHSDANLIIVRACSVTNRAERECNHLVEHIRSKHPSKRIVVCGCTKNRTDTATTTTAGRAHATPLTASPKFPTPDAALPTRTARAYLKVQDGCSGKCAFCIVPNFRGKSSSIGFGVALDRAKRFIDSGYRELVVTGCNLSLYASEGGNLADLVSALADIDPNCRVRVGSVEPGERARELVDAMASHTNVCRFLHLAVQSGSDRTLFAMRRPYTAEDVENTVSRAVEKLPTLGLGCDLITGFPGETDLDFSKTRLMLLRLPFNNAHIFPFSTRPDTPAATMPDRLPHELRSERAHELNNLVVAKRAAFARSFIGKEVEFVVENAKGAARGWSGEYLACESFGEMPRKSLAKMAVTRTRGDTLVGIA